MSSDARSTGSPKNSRRKLARWAVAAIAVGVLSVLICIHAHSQACADDITCKQNLRHLWETVTTDDRPPCLLQKVEAPLWAGVSNIRRCPSCGRDYEYRPFKGPIRLSAGNGKDALRVIAWCPASCHKGRRNVLVETGVVVAIPERAFRKLLEAELTATWEELVRMVESRTVW